MFHAEIEATSHCNTRCLHCPHEAITRPAGRMNWGTFVTITDKIRAYTGGERYSLSFSGMGEPMLNPLLYRFIQHVSAEATTSFASNGAALTEDNVARLIAAGLDFIYLSFNGDEPALFAKMMGGLSYERVLGNVRRAVALARGTRLQLRANMSITQQNKDRVTATQRLLESEGVGPLTYSLCHNRGGNLKDREVCDTPVMETTGWNCDVMANTLFVDWQGRAHICDHDLHGEYELGDLVTEPLANILERRQKLLENGAELKICQGCNDIMRVGGTKPLASGAGGVFRDWIHYLYQDLADPLSEANPPMRWIFRIYEKEHRLDRLANRLLALEKAAQVELQRERRESAQLQQARQALHAENADLRAERAGLVEKISGLQAQLDQRDREFGALHADYVRLRRSRAWRLGNAVAKILHLGRRRPLAGRAPG